MSTRLLLFGLLVGTLLSTTASAKDSALEVRGGVVTFAHGQSIAIPHKLKPMVRMEWSHGYPEGIRYGLEALTVPDPLEGYRLFGGLFNVHARMVESGLFSMWWRAGVGVGNGPPILYKDLGEGEPWTLLANMGLAFRFQLGDSMSLSLNLGEENLTAVSVDGGVAFHF